MKKIFKVFKRDIKNIIKNPAAIIIITGLSFIPSLYAWVNIKACWNPYVNTGSIPVAVVNEDTGATINGESVNVGNKIVDQLKKNKDIGWQFVGDWQGNYGLNEGNYYALIEIPQNFSSDLVSLSTKDPKKPDIIYKANEKVNAIATKITSVAKSHLTQEIKSNFIDTVNKEAFKYLNKFGDEIKKNKPQILELKTSLDQAQNNLNKISNQLNTSTGDISDIQKYLGEAKNQLPTVTNSINSLQGMVQGSKDLITNTQLSTQNLSNGMKNDLLQIQMINDKYNELLNKLGDINNNPVDVIALDKTIDQMQSTLDTLNKTIESNKQTLEDVNKTSKDDKIQKQIDILSALQGIIAQDKSTLTSLKGLIDSGKITDGADKLLKTLDNLSTSFSNNLTSSSNTFYNSTLPALNAIGSNISQGATNANNVLEGSKVVIPQLNALANFGIASGDVASSQISNVSSKLTEFRSKLNSVQNETKDITSSSLDEAIKMMEKSPDEMASFMSSPIEVKTVEVYDTGIFGVALTPFYTVLGIWVGILLMLALLTTECEDFEDGEKISVMQKHFGKLLLFLTVGIIQTVIVLAGDIGILGVRPENTLLFFGMGLLSCIVFTMIIFTLVSLFGNIGKAIAVVIMVFQIAGAGGIYPIQTNPKIFEVLEPLWPFTYAIDGFREAIAGPIWSNTIHDIKMLCLFGVIFFILGVVKKNIYKVTMFMEHKFKESGL
ncbi:YhgE/Pip domain-containing protein [Clostridium sardiniense]|uniref:YhgE/Pip domain-containing protein n=1 Tax=Clostridium sardiniense TaxID=29369 RepID=A0ABS7KWS7_CLOSR|nr:YhgE/Pip domain-containing protein [Clostridium sardiniense]MBY0755260.1 YhgE/Pip domain-containing protein [Clostridium sardiniense]MDQ0459703.1 putative membrane protein [Clostridium sardiniense]